MSTLWPNFPSLSLRYDQPVSPVTAWFPTTVNYQGNSTIEQRVTEDVASFGRQLGILSDALLEVADGKKQRPETERLRTMVARINAIKAQQAASLADRTTDSFDALANKDLNEARDLLKRLAASIKRAEDKKSKSRI